MVAVAVKPRILHTQMHTAKRRIHRLVIGRIHAGKLRQLRGVTGFQRRNQLPGSRTEHLPLLLPHKGRGYRQVMAIRQHGIGQGTGKHPADHHRQHHFCPRRQLLPVQRPQDPLFGRTSAKIRVLQRMPAGIRPVQQGLGILHPPVRVQKPQYTLIAGGLHILDHKPPGQPGQRIEPMEDRRRCKQLQNHVIPAAHMGQFMQQNILGALRLPLHLDRQCDLRVKKAKYQGRRHRCGVDYRNPFSPCCTGKQGLHGCEVSAAATGQLFAQQEIPRQHPCRLYHRHSSPQTGGKSQQFFCNQMLTACHALQYRLLRIKIRYRKQDATGRGQGFSKQIEQAGRAGQRIGHQHTEQKRQPEKIQKARAAKTTQQSAQQQHEQKQHA